MTGFASAQVAPALDIINIRIVYRENVGKYTVSWTFYNPSSIMVGWRIYANHFVTVNSAPIQYDLLSEFGTINGHLDPGAYWDYDNWAQWYYPAETGKTYTVCLKTTEYINVNGEDRPILSLYTE